MVVKRVDPSQPQGVIRRGVIAFGRTSLGRSYGINFSARVDPFLLKHSGGRIRTVGGIPTLLLRTTGAKSGVERENPVFYFNDGDDVVLIASSFGREKSPGWFHNLAAHPDCALNGDPYVATQVQDEAERERLFALGVQVYAGYADYKVRTDAIGRRIPILRLTSAPR